jgi:hypothetical protein
MWKVVKTNIFKWHPWFAWHPVTVRVPGAEVKVWLEIIERRRVPMGPWDMGFNMWEYRLSTIKD